MEITFLLGNGFDIQCGLKTSYFDFYKFILKERYNIDLEDDESSNSKLKITNQIYKEIYMSKDTPETWADLEGQLGKHTYNLKEDSVNNFLDDYEELNEDLNHYLNLVQIQPETNITDDFSAIFKETATDFFEGLFPQEKTDIISILNKNMNLDTNYNYRFITFNYTNTLDLFIKNCKEKIIDNNFNKRSLKQTLNTDIINVHGKVNRLVTLGVNDETQLAKDIFEEIDLNDLMKPMILENNREHTKRNAEHRIENSHIIVIFGMSLGATDEYWWIKVAESLLLSSNRRLIIHMYSSDEVSDAVPRKVRKRRESKEDEFIKRLMKMNLTEADEKKIREQTYIITNSNSVLNLDFKKYLPNLEKGESNKIIQIQDVVNGTAD